VQNNHCATLAALTVVAMVLGTGTLAAQAPSNAAHVHIGHVMTSWNDTPEMKGFLLTALAEAEIAEEEAHRADLEGRLNDFILYAGYVLNALDPSPETKALLKDAYARLPTTTMNIKVPGSGYGVKKAVANALQHVQLAAKAEGASENVKTHATHVSASLENVAQWTDQAIATAKKILVTTDVGQGQPLVTDLEYLAMQINAGVDANKDGRIGWQTGEGGLAHAELHMKLMMKGEGL
jgi:hypothetical protein